MSEALPTPAWVDEVFDRDYLDTYEPFLPPDGAEREALGAARLAGVAAGAQILDAPCGFGRHSSVLARAGYHVTGVDRSPLQLGAARERAGGAEWPHLVEADYRQLPFDDGSFDAVLNLFSSIGYLGDAEDLTALREWRRVLRPGGTLVVETLHRDRLLTGFRETTWEEVPAGWFLQRHAWDAIAGVVSSTHTLVRRGGQARSRSFALRVYSVTELVAMIRAAGFAGVACYGDLDGGEFAGSASRLVVVASR